ncbi:hypothetical protein RV18_GL003673 [Enterococcus termitis]|nr:hypothetical protein RV18_GL003673 [Enterococcus termitis]
MIQISSFKASADHIQYSLYHSHLKTTSRTFPDDEVFVKMNSKKG